MIDQASSVEVTRWLLPIDSVKAAMDDLWRLKIHNSFPAYLCLKHLSLREGRTTGLRGSWQDFFEEFFKVPGGQDGSQVYLRPFNSRSQARQKMWLNGNLAGSFAAGSLRAGQPFTKVVRISGKGVATRYSLKPKHWELALKHLTGGRPVPVVELASFLYRDYALLSPVPPSFGDLVTVFREEFGYLEGAGLKEFELLYVDDSSSRPVPDWEEILRVRD